jgi:hypothetical protein
MPISSSDSLLSNLKTNYQSSPVIFLINCAAHLDMSTISMHLSPIFSEVTIFILDSFRTLTAPVTTMLQSNDIHFSNNELKIYFLFDKNLEELFESKELSVNSFSSGSISGSNSIVSNSSFGSHPTEDLLEIVFNDYSSSTHCALSVGDKREDDDELLSILSNESFVSNTTGSISGDITNSNNSGIFCYHHVASSVVIYYALKHSEYRYLLELKPEGTQILWSATVGLTDQLLHKKCIPKQFYDFIVLDLVSSLKNESIDIMNERNILFYKDNELDLFMYRHWTLYDSLLHSSQLERSNHNNCSSHSATHEIEFNYMSNEWWDERISSIKEFLARCGISLSEAQNPFLNMSPNSRNLLFNAIGNNSTCNISILQYKCILQQYDITLCVTAGDMLYAIYALLDHSERKDSSYYSGYQKAIDALAGDKKLIFDGIREAISLRKTMFYLSRMIDYSKLPVYSSISNIIDLQYFDLHITSPLSQTSTSEEAFEDINSTIMFNTSGLSRFAILLCEINPRFRLLPLIVCAPANKDRRSVWIVAIDTMRYNSNRRGSSLYEIFKRASEDVAEFKIMSDLVDNFAGNKAVVEIPAELKNDFFTIILHSMTCR